jgi:hypothetical protein
MRGMPDRTRMKVGDRIRLLRVPPGDLEQRERELREGREYAGWTADTLERIIAQDPVVTIVEIDEWGYPWFRYDLRREDGTVEEHSVAVMEDDSWEWV